MLKNYFAPTPALYRKIGDSILLLGTTLTATLASLEVNKGWVIAATLLTTLGKIVTNFFTESTDQKEP